MRVFAIQTAPFSESMSNAVAPYLPKISTNDAISRSPSEPRC